MARRLLGADSAAVFNIQEPEEETANQEIGSPHASVGSPLDGQKVKLFTFLLLPVSFTVSVSCVLPCLPVYLS